MSRRFRLPLRALGAVLVAFALVVSACGGDDDDAPADDTVDAPDDASAGPVDDDTDDTDAADDDETDTSETTKTTVADDGAEPSVPSVPHDEGIDDPPVAVADLAAGDVVVGRFEAAIETPGQLCVALRSDEAETTGVHIHIGALGETGDVLVDVTETLVAVPDQDWSAGCMAVTEETASAIAKSTDALYVDVHTPAAPDGALRGQLASATLFDLEMR